MKLMYGNVPVKSLNIHTFERDTNDATLKASDMQTGVTAYAKGKKVVGTGKAFEFATYGTVTTNVRKYVPTDINIIEISSSEHPIKLTMDLLSMRDIDFSDEQNVATVVVNNNEYDLVVSVQSNIMVISCDETVRLQVFYGKDNYV